MNATASPARRHPGARCFFYAIIVLATWNAVLRPSVDVPITPYYLLAPFIGAWLLVCEPPFRRWMAWFTVVAAYGLAVGTVYGVPLAMQFAQLLKYFQLLTFFGILAWLRRDAHATRGLTGLVAGLTLVLFAIAGVQALTGIQFPTVVNEESSLWLNAYFFTPNDVALFLGGVACLLLSSDLPRMHKLAGVVLISALNLRNDAKAVLLATSVMLVMSVLLWACTRTRTRPVVAVAIMFVGVPIAVFACAEVAFEAGETGFDFAQLFIDPLIRIRELNPYDLGGSIFDRTDALIYALQALRSMSWLGLGPAGSVYTLALPNFELLTAKSLHNALAELLVEFGPVMFLLFLLILRPVFSALFRVGITGRDHGRILLVTASPLLSVSQSSGYISNYAFWLVAYVVWLRVETPPSRGSRQSTPTQRPSPVSSKEIPA